MHAILACTLLGIVLLSWTWKLPPHNTRVVESGKE